MRFRLLELCARIDGHLEQHTMLQQLSSEVADWQALLTKAEQEGVTPLLAKHWNGTISWLRFARRCSSKCWAYSIRKVFAVSCSKVALLPTRYILIPP